MIAIRMLVDADGAPHGHTIYSYEAGEVYAPDTLPPATEWLMSAFVTSGRAVEVDASGNPVVTPASRRAKKAVASDSATDSAEASSDAPAPSGDATQADSDAASATPATIDPAADPVPDGE